LSAAHKVTLKHDNYVVDYSTLGTNVLNESKPAMSNPNGLQTEPKIMSLP